jgi:glycosyltransferase involved in cell wall biosynthesis
MVKAEAQEKHYGGSSLTKPDRAIPNLFLMTDSFATGGSERQFAALASSLDPTLFKAHLGCLQKRGGFLEGLEGALEFSPGGSLYGMRSVGARLRLAHYLRRSKTQIAHAFDFYTNLMLIPSARLARVPVVIGSQRQMGDLLSPAKFRAQLAAFRWCDAVICNSRAAAAWLTKSGLPAHRIAVIGNGLPDSAFLRPPPALPRAPGQLRVGMIARMNTSSKNHSGFLRVAARMSKRFSEIEFILVGDGPLRPELERKAAELGIGHCVHFLGDRRDIGAILASLDVSVLPSASESLSNAILESMAAGVPVVANRVGGNPELIAPDRGVLVEDNDEAALADGIDLLLRDPGRRAELGQNARKFAQSHFTIANMRRQHEDLYLQLLAGRLDPRRSFGYLGSTDGWARRTRVAIVAASLRYVGGQSVQADLLMSNWHGDREIDARLIAIDPPFPRGLKWVERIPGLRTILREPLYLLKLWRGLRDTDVAHIFSASYWSFLIAVAPAWLVARLRRMPVLLHYHSGEARDHLSRFRSAHSLLAKVDQIVVPSGYLVDVFREFGLPAKIVPNVADVERFSFRVRKPLRPHLICTRGFHAYYCIDVVLRAFAEVQREFEHARLDLVGGGPLEVEIRQLAAKMQIQGVNFAGVASREQIAKLYDSADVFLNASCLDNMPVSILEAFASGNPVVTTAPECMNYLVEHERTGLLSEVGNAQALAQNVIRLLRDPELSSRIALNAYRECERYRWRDVRQQWIDAYSSLTKESVETKRGLVGVG